MPHQDLRGFLDTLERAGELARVQVEVDPEYEVAAICRKVLNNAGPALQFERLKGHDMPLACNLFATRQRYALALETSTAELTGEIIRRMAQPVPPIIVDEAPC